MFPMKPIFSPRPVLRPRLGLLALALGGAALLGGCSLIPAPKPDPTRYFVLAGPEAAAGADRSPDVPVVVLAALEVPGYLRTTRNLVVRAAGNEVTFVDGARWGEPLEAGLARVLRETLVGEGRVGRVVQPPLAAAVPGVRPIEVRVQILACEGRVRPAGGWVASFSARYEIVHPGTAGGSGVAALPGVFVASERPWNGRDHGELARLLSEAAADFGRELGGRLAAAP